MPRQSLTRRDPFFNELVDFRRGFDDFFQRFFGPSQSFGGDQFTANWLPPIETYMDQGRYHVKLALPGVDPKDVNIEAHGNELYISGERKREEEVSEDKYVHREFSYGSFQRVVPLPEGVEADRIEATCNNGVLEIAAPISEKAMPKRIEVKTGEGSQARTVTPSAGKEAGKERERKIA